MERTSKENIIYKRDLKDLNEDQHDYKKKIDEYFHEIILLEDKIKGYKKQEHLILAAQQSA